MPSRLAPGFVVVVVACGQDVPASDRDAALDADPGGDAQRDAAPDSTIPDTTPPSLVAVTPEPGAEVWLHEPIRFVFDEPVTVDGALVSASNGTVAIAATLALEGDRTLVVSLAPGARGIGALATRLGSVRDLADNELAQPIDVAHVLPAWNRPPIDRGPAASSPALAVTATGSVVAAWTVGPAASRRVVVSRHERGAWEPLGSTLGAMATTSPAVVVDASERPVVAWIEGGAARVTRWNGSTWSELPSPGSGGHVVLATPPGGGDPTAAVVGATVAVRRLVGDAWQLLGPDLPFGGSLVGEPALAVPAAGRAAVGWIEVAGGVPRVRVSRFTTSWTELAPIVLGAPPAGFDRMSLAARDQTIAVAWDQWGGSFGVHAAIATGAATSWTRLGRALDVDVAGDAFAPAVALDASGAPIVAWRERIEAAERGVIARWTGTAWAIVGGPTWLAPATPTTRPSLALHAGQAPVVGWSGAGAIGIARFNGPRVPSTGIAARAPIAGCTFSSTAPPPSLLQTGCFTLAGAGRPAPHAGLVPYDLIVELWSDGTKKRRWIALPDTASMTAAANGSWTAPAGAFVIKEFAIETTPGDPATRRAIETRFLARTATGWDGFTYLWRANGSDADLRIDEATTVDWPIAGGSYRHFYPSRSQCARCHHPSTGPLLGLRAPQLARWVDYDGTIAAQLPTLAGIAVGPGATAAPWIAPHDPSATAEQRMRGYMASNCSHCHNPANVAIKDLRFTTPLAQTRLCEVIVPGSPSLSNIYQRVTARPGMPPLGTLAVDPLAEQLLAGWIAGMTSCP